MNRQPTEGPGAPFTMIVEAGKIREFARATKSDNPDHLRDESPVSPPTFLMSAVFWASPENQAPGRPTDLSRLLHGEQSFTFHGEPPRAGTVLTCQSRVERTYEKEGRRAGTMTFTVVVTEFRDQSGALVAEARSTGIETGRPAVAGGA